MIKIHPFPSRHRSPPFLGLTRRNASMKLGNSTCGPQVGPRNAINAFHERLEFHIWKGNWNRKRDYAELAGMNPGSEILARRPRAQYLTFKVVCDWQTCRGHAACPVTVSAAKLATPSPSRGKLATRHRRNVSSTTKSGQVCSISVVASNHLFTPALNYTHYSLYANESRKLDGIFNFLDGNRDETRFPEYFFSFFFNKFLQRLYKFVCARFEKWRGEERKLGSEREE